ncbi:MAG TPA: hypothetical protein VHM30_14000 [Gemmatimonadaceae bacterium]|nr:hypothetical protein [Gemmatimonadaceae bacterium]
MSAQSVAQTLEALLDLHRRDQDGGDRLVRAVIRHARGLPPADRDALVQHLFGLVDSEDARVWRIALEALVRMGAPTTARALIGMLTDRERSSEWSDAIVVALLRLGSPDAVVTCRTWVQEELRLHHLGALPMLAWLYRADRDDALPIAARFYAEVLGIDATIEPELLAELRRQLPLQLEGLLASGTATALDLVDRVAELDATASRTLAALVAAYLTAADAPLRLGARAVEALGEAIRLRAS